MFDLIRSLPPTLKYEAGTIVSDGHTLQGKELQSETEEILPKVSADIDYARRLIDAGVLTELFVAPGAYHAFDLISPDSSISKAFTAAKYDALRRAFGLKA